MEAARQVTKSLGRRFEAEKGRSALIRQVVSVTADILGDDKQGAIKEARDKILKWLSLRVGKLPPEAWDGNSFEHMSPGRFAAGVAIALPDGEYWAVRCDDPDRSVPGRTWTTEISLARNSEHSKFGLRLIVATSEIEPSYLPSIPGVVRQLCESPGLARNGRTVAPNPLIVDSEERLEQFIELLFDPRRRNPIFGISLDEYESDPTKAVIDPFNLAVRCLGIAHVVVIAGPQAFQLSDRLGKLFSVFRGAVRTYRAGMTADDDPYRHPLAMASQIREWHGVGPDAFANTLLWTASRNSSLSNDEARELPLFTKAKQVALQFQRSAAQDSDYPALLALADEELSEKQREIEALESMLLEEESKRSEAELHANDLIASNSFLRSRVVELDKKRPTGGDRIVFPTSYDGIPSWAEEKYAGRLRLLPRAHRDLKNAEFEDVKLVSESLDYLGTVFWRMKTEGGIDLVKENEKKLAGLNIKNESTGAEHLLKEQGDTYLVRWGASGRKRLLDMHIKNGGATRDPSRCLRIYYFWDDDTQQVVVGSLPAHLNSRLS